MNRPDFNAFANRFMEEMESILVAKGADYAGQDDDRHGNFKRVAAALGLRPIQTWAVFAMKHVDAIMTYARTGSVASEEIRGRFLDLANYALLGAALVAEVEKQK